MRELGQAAGVFVESCMGRSQRMLKAAHSQPGPEQVCAMIWTSYSMLEVRVRVVRYQAHFYKTLSQSKPRADRNRTWLR